MLFNRPAAKTLAASFFLFLRKCIFVINAKMVPLRLQ